MQAIAISIDACIAVVNNSQVQLAQTVNIHIITFPSQFWIEVYSFWQSRANPLPLPIKNRTLKQREQIWNVKSFNFTIKSSTAKIPISSFFHLEPQTLFLHFFFTPSLFSFNSHNASLYIISCFLSWPLPSLNHTLFSLLFIFSVVLRFSISLVFLGLVFCFPGVVLRLFLF